MAFEIPAHFHKSFTTNTELLLQQKDCRFGAAVTHKAYTGESAQVVKQFGEVEFEDKTGRGTDTNWADIQHKQRWAFPADKVLSLPVDKEDELRMLDSPVSPYVEAMTAAWNRKKDAVIATALVGTAQTGTSGSTATAWPSSQRIVVGATGLTLAKLKTAKKMFDQAEVDDAEQRYIACTSEQVEDLLNEDKINSNDYNTVRALVRGEVDSFMGFKFIRYEGLAVDSSSSRRCIAWVPSGIVLGQWNGLTTNIGPRADKNYTNQIHMAGTLGATRTQEKKVVEILCAE